MKRLLCFFFGHTFVTLEEKMYCYEPMKCLEHKDPFHLSPTEDLQVADIIQYKKCCSVCGAVISYAEFI